MSERHRRRNENPEHGRRRMERRIETGTVVAVPTYPETSRPGLDAQVIIALKSLDELVRDMRIGVDFPSEIINGETALRYYLLYLSVLVDVALADMAMSAMHRNDLMVLMKQRMLIEYATKASYFDDNRDYALWMMTIGEAQQVLRKLRDAKSNPNAITAAKQRVAELRKRFPRLAHFQKPEKFSRMMRLYGSPDDVVWLYNAPSALMHGDPEGIREMMDTETEDGSRICIEFSLDKVNAMLVDSGRNSLMFCNRFIGCFQQTDESLVSRYKTLYKTFLKLLIAHPYGRDPEIMQAVKDELAVL